MKKLSVFYILIFLPLFMAILAAYYKFFSAETLFWVLAFYVIVYHPLVSALRLFKNNKIPKSQIWHCFIPLFNWKYFSFLFLNKQ